MTGEAAIALYADPVARIRWRDGQRIIALHRFGISGERCAHRQILARLMRSRRAAIRWLEDKGADYAAFIHYLRDAACAPCVASPPPPHPPRGLHPAASRQWVGGPAICLEGPAQRQRLRAAHDAARAEAPEPLRPLESGEFRSVENHFDIPGHLQKITIVKADEG